MTLRRRRVSIAAIAVAVSLLQAGGPSSTAADDAARFEQTSCLMIWNESPARCGILIVPENRRKPGSREIRLPVVILMAEEDGRADDPVLFINGGPGGATISSAPFISFWAAEKRAKPWLAKRDLILSDARGAGRAKPSLECPEIDRLPSKFFSLPSASAETHALIAEGIMKCRSRLLEQGIDLAGYTTRENAADVQDLIRALGIGNWNIYGSSYGTRVALAVMRDNPAGLRSVILDSVYPPNAAGSFGQPQDLVRSLEGLARLCTGRDACTRDGGSFISSLDDLMSQLEVEPHTVRVMHPDIGQMVDVTIDVNRLATVLHRSFYYWEYMAVLPERVLELQQGDSSVYKDSAETLVHEWSHYMPISDGVWLNVQCSDEGAALPQVPGGRLPASIREIDLWPRERFWYELCEGWGITPVDLSEKQAVRSDVPTLLLSGGLDPVTPPAWARTAAKTLPNGTLVEIPWAGHSVLQMSDCASQIAGAFIDAPSTKPDTSCVAAEKAPWQ